MALTEYQIEILRLLAEDRKKSGVSYVAGGVALGHSLQSARRSEDIDLFHDSEEALWVTWQRDRQILETMGHEIRVIREAPSFVEGQVVRGMDSVLIQWARDSAFRFFPLIEDDLLGLTLHPLDLAANKLLALVGRLEPRDWIDIIECHQKLQPLGYLVWAACGKDPGVNPDSLLSDAAKQRYVQPELDILSFEGPPPNASATARIWKEAIRSGRSIVARLPTDQVGTCLLTPDGRPYCHAVEQLEDDVQRGRILFHPGRLHGAWPRLIPSPPRER